MITKYTKNVNPSDFQKLLNKFQTLAQSKIPLWKGTVYIGTQPLYIECHIKWLADKINDYFVSALQNKHIDGAKEIYILNKETKELVEVPTSEYSDLFFLGSDIFDKPDFILNNDYIFLRTPNKYFISVSDENERHFLYLDENHLLARLFYYIFEPQETMVLHSAAVAYDDYGILITGLSGAGKSTLSGTCLTQGMKFVGDDKIALHIENGELYANPIYTTLSLKRPLDGIKVASGLQQRYENKDVFILDKSQISKNIKIRAIVEPHNTGLDQPEILTVPKSPVITRICTDYSVFSVLTPTKNPLTDYKKIFDLFCGIDFYRINLSKSIEANALAIFKLAKKGDVNVQ